MACSRSSSKSAPERTIAVTMASCISIGLAMGPSAAVLAPLLALVAAMPQWLPLTQLLLLWVWHLQSDIAGEGGTGQLHMYMLHLYEPHTST